MALKRPVSKILRYTVSFAFCRVNFQTIEVDQSLPKQLKCGSFLWAVSSVGRAADF
jgi:hypothetical protein